jgi:hypothetical protein
LYVEGSTVIAKVDTFIRSWVPRQGAHYQAEANQAEHTSLLLEYGLLRLSSCKSRLVTNETHHLLGLEHELKRLIDKKAAHTQGCKLEKLQKQIHFPILRHVATSYPAGAGSERKNSLLNKNKYKENKN